MADPQLVLDSTDAPSAHSFPATVISHEPTPYWQASSRDRDAVAGPAAVWALLAATGPREVCRALAEAGARLGDGAVASLTGSTGGVWRLSAGRLGEPFARLLDPDGDIIEALLRASDDGLGSFRVEHLSGEVRRVLEALGVGGGAAARLSPNLGASSIFIVLDTASDLDGALADAVSHLAELASIAAGRALAVETQADFERAAVEETVRALLGLLGIEPEGSLRVGHVADSTDAATRKTTGVPLSGWVDELGARTLEVINAIGRHVAMIPNLPAYLETVTAEIARLTPDASCTIELSTSESNALVRDGSDPPSGWTVGHPHQRGNGHPSSNHSSVRRPGAHPASGSARQPRTVVGPGTAVAEIAAPVAWDDRLLGVVVLRRNQSDSPPFTAAEERALAQVIQRLAPALAVALQHEELKRAAGTDALTRLSNHRVFYGALKEALARAEGNGPPVSVVLFDIEGLKLINDTQGHLAGDALLRQFARLLKGSVRSADLVARYGGDESALVMPHADAEQARAAGLRVRRALRRRSVASPLLQRVAVTFGVAMSPADGTKAAELVETADHQLYAARGQRADNHRGEPLSPRGPSRPSRSPRP